MLDERSRKLLDLSPPRDSTRITKPERSEAPASTNLTENQSQILEERSRTVIDVPSLPGDWRVPAGFASSKARSKISHPSQLTDNQAQRVVKGRTTTVDASDSKLGWAMPFSNAAQVKSARQLRKVKSDIGDARSSSTSESTEGDERRFDEESIVQNETFFA